MISVIVFNGSLINRLEGRKDEGVLAHLISECLFSFVGGSNFFKETWSLIIKTSNRLFILTGKVVDFVVIFDISIELPDKDSVLGTCTDDLSIISWVEHN
jgi:hypothetical protein